MTYAATKMGPSNTRRDQRRKHARYVVNRPGVLRNPVEGDIAIRVLDISLSGLLVALPCRLRPQTEVQVEFEGALVKGVVRHCQCLGAAEFTVGIWLLECNPEDPSTLNPEYLQVLRSGLDLTSDRRTCASSRFTS